MDEYINRTFKIILAFCLGALTLCFFHFMTDQLEAGKAIKNCLKIKEGDSEEEVLFKMGSPTNIDIYYSEVEKKKCEYWDYPDPFAALTGVYVIFDKDTEKVIKFACDENH